MKSENGEMPGLLETIDPAREAEGPGATLHRVFETLDRAGVPYCVLDGYEGHPAARAIRRRRLRHALLRVDVPTCSPPRRGERSHRGPDRAMAILHKYPCDPGSGRFARRTSIPPPGCPLRLPARRPPLLLGGGGPGEPATPRPVVGARDGYRVRCLPRQEDRQEIAE